MERERIVERDFMGLINTDGIAEKKDDKEKLPKDPSINSSIEDRSHNSLPENTPSQRLGVTPIVYPAGPIEGLSSSAHSVNEYGGFPSSTISLSMQNFRQQLGSNALLKGQQAVCNAHAASSMANPSTVQQHPFFLPYASNYPNSTATSKSATIPGNPSCAQLTIFYAGTVNVYDDVPTDKAQGLMLLAASARSTKTTNLPPRSSVMSMAMSTGSHIVSVPSPFSPSLPNRASPVTPQASVQKAQASSLPNQSAGISLNNGDFQTNQNIVTSNTQQESSKSSATVINPAPVVPRVPQARKASLARFLEKRKERIITKAPYPVKKSPDCSPQSEESPSSTHASPSVDGCLAKNHQMTSSGLDDKIPIDSENIESCLDRDKMDLSSSQKAPKSVQEECKITV